MFNDLRIRFINDGNFRMIMYFISLVLTCVNIPIMMIPDTEALRWILIALTGVVTWCIYNISGGIPAIKTTTMVLSRIMGVFFSIVFIILPWVAAWLQFICMCATGIMCIALAYMFPIVGVPVFGLINRTMIKKTKETAASETLD